MYTCTCIICTHSSCVCNSQSLPCTFGIVIPVGIVGAPMSMHTHKVGKGSVKRARSSYLLCTSRLPAHFCRHCICTNYCKFPIIANSIASYFLESPWLHHRIHVHVHVSNRRHCMGCIVLLATNILWEHYPPGKKCGGTSPSCPPGSAYVYMSNMA